MGLLPGTLIAGVAFSQCGRDGQVVSTQIKGAWGCAYDRDVAVGCVGETSSIWLCLLTVDVLSTHGVNSA